MRTRVSCLAICVAGVCALAACNDESTANTTAVVSVADSSAAPEVSTAVTTLVADDMERLLISDLPTGFEQVPDSEFDTGPSDLAKAVVDDGAADAEDVLVAAGFVRGYQRAWQTADGSDRVIVSLYEFSNVDGAASYRDRGLAALEDDSSMEVVPFDVASVPEASGRSLTNLESAGGQAALVVFTKDVHLVQVTVIGPTDEANQALAQQLAQDQFDRV